MEGRHISRFVRCSVEINIIPDKERKDRPDFTAVVAFAAAVCVQQFHQHIGVKELLRCFGSEMLFYNIVVFLFAQPDAEIGTGKPSFFRCAVASGR